MQKNLQKIIKKLRRANKRLRKKLRQLLYFKKPSKALLVGINYLGTDSELKGCVNDVQNVKNYLQNQNLYDSIEVMTDFTKDNLPTKQNILKALKNLCIDPGERIFFHFSGHGTFQHDFNHDETDGKDECLVTKDMQVIVDDDLYEIFQTLPENVTVHALIDCCHSGTMLDLPHIFQENKWITQNPNHNLRAKICVISGCMDHQYSMDQYIQGQFQGALTQAFLEEIQSKCSNLEMVINLQKRLKQQHPTLSISHESLRHHLFFRD